MMHAIQRANVLLSSSAKYGCSGYGFTTVKNRVSSAGGGVGARFGMLSRVDVDVDSEDCRYKVRGSHDASCYIARTAMLWPDALCRHRAAFVRPKQSPCGQSHSRVRGTALSDKESKRLKRRDYWLWTRRIVLPAKV